MNSDSRSSSPVVVILITLILGLFILVSVLLAEGNTIGQLCRFLLPAGFLLGLILPRFAFFIWLGLCGCTDLIKRLMIIDGRISYEDLPFVLGITPAMFGGIVVSLVFGAFIGSRRLQGRDWLVFFLGIIAIFLFGGIAFAQKAGVTGILQAMANNGLYTLMLFAAPLLFPSAAEMMKLWRYLVVLFLPVAIYGMVQQICGFAEFEVEYLKTGFSIEIKQLFTDEVRAFSTLNSPSALSVVCGCLAMMSLWLGFGPGIEGQRRFLSRPMAMLGFLIHSGGLLASTSRTPVLILPLSLLGAWCFASPRLTRTFYLVTVGAFVGLVVISPWLVQHLDSVNQAIGALGAPSFVTRMLAVGTYWDRLYGFATVLMDPEAWTLFGFGLHEDGTGRFHFHDPVSEVLIRFGAIALALMLGIVAFSLRTFHRQAWRIQTRRERQVAASFIALIFALLMVSAVGGSILTVFPNNILFWLCGASVMVLSRGAIQSRPVRAAAIAPPPDPRPTLNRRFLPTAPSHLS